MPIREIPRDEWSSFFDTFSRQHHGWLVTIEVAAPENGLQHPAKNLPLERIKAASGGLDQEVITISVGKKPPEQLAYDVVAPTAVRLEQSEEGADEALEIDAASGVVTVVRFRSAIRPELVDGIV